jgi:hypothetical protein
MIPIPQRRPTPSQTGQVIRRHDTYSPATSDTVTDRFLVLAGYLISDVPGMRISVPDAQRDRGLKRQTGDPPSYALRLPLFDDKKKAQSITKINLLPLSTRPQNRTNVKADTLTSAASYLDGPAGPCPGALRPCIGRQSPGSISAYENDDPVSPTVIRHRKRRIKSSPAFPRSARALRRAAITA